MDAALHQIDATLPPGQVQTHERGLMRPRWREEVRGGRDASGLQLERLKLPPDLRNVTIGQLERIELIPVKRKLDSRISRLIYGVDRLGKRQLRQTESAVAQLDHRFAPKFTIYKYSILLVAPGQGQGGHT